MSMNKHHTQGKGPREQSQTKGLGERHFWTLFYSHALPLLTDPTLISNATDPSIPYMTTDQDHLLSFLPQNLIAFSHSIP